MGTDNIPELSVGIDDNFQNLLEEMPVKEIYNMGIGIGIIIGIIVGIIFSLILVMVVYYFQEESKEKATMENPKKSDDEKEKRVTKYIAYLLILAIIFGSIFGLAFTNGYFNKDYESSERTENNQISTPEERDATSNDIYCKTTKISNDNRTITIQASEKIKGLVIEVKFVDKNGKILKIQEINVGNISPGNEFTYKLDFEDMKASDINKVNSFKIKVTNGTIKE